MRKLIIGLIIGLLIGTTGSVLASEGAKVTAVYQKFHYIVNGEPVTVDADALVVDGRSHLPTRTLAEFLGYDVDYIDGPIGTIVLTSKQPQSEPSTDETTNRGVEEMPKTAEPVVREYQIGEEFTLGTATLKFIEVEYSERRDGFVANPGDKFAIIKFEVLAESAPIHVGRLSPIHFVSHAVVDSINVSSFFVTGNSMWLKIGEKQNAEVIASIPEDSSVSAIFFKNPESRAELARIDIQ